MMEEKKVIYYRGLIQAEYSKQYRKNNPEKMKLYRERMKIKHPDYKEYYRKYYEKYKNKLLKDMKKRYLLDKEKILAYQKSYCLIHKEKISQYQKRWYVKNRIEVLKRASEYGRLHPVELNKRRHQHKYGMKIEGNLTEHEWEDIKKAFNYLCAICKSANVKLEIDHIIPISKGGQHSKDNVQPLCKSCNSRKGDKILCLQ